MADERVSYEVAARFTGEGELRRGASEFDRLADKSKAALSTTTAGGPIAAAGNAWSGLAVGLGVAGAAYFAVSQVAGKAYAAMRGGAELQTTTERFGKLAASIGTTADVMLGKLRTATKGMISDAELMASASGIVSLKLADNQEQVVRLATVVGTLGWDMQQVILTFANLSTMRLDALGLSVDEVKQKQKELMDQGMSTAAAFKEAVIQAGEARLDVGGVSESEQAFKKAEAAVLNFKNSLLLSTVATLEQAGAIDAISDAANRMSLLQQLTELDEQARALGLQFDSLPERAIRSNELARSSTSELRSEIILVDNALQANQDSWTRTGDVAVAAMKNARAEARQVAAELNALFLEITGLAGIELEWAGGISDEFDYMAAGARAGKDYRSGLAIEARQARIDQNLQFVRHDPDFITSGREVRNEMEYAAEATYGYSSALGSMTSAEQEAAEAHSRFLSSFNEELRAKPEDGLYNAEGVANVEAVNKALYEQVAAAGASAATLALLGVATGQFTQEQAEAALKAAVLQEQIRAIAASVAAGDLSIGAALGQLSQAREALDASNLEAIAGTGEAGVQIAVTADTTTADSNLDGTVAQLDSLTSEEYIATVGMDINAVIAGTTEASRLISSIPDTKTMTIRWEQSGADVIAALRALGIIV